MQRVGIFLRRLGLGLGQVEFIHIQLVVRACTGFILVSVIVQTDIDLIEIGQIEVADQFVFDRIRCLTRCGLFVHDLGGGRVEIISLGIEAKIEVGPGQIKFISLVGAHVEIGGFRLGVFEVSGRQLAILTTGKQRIVGIEFITHDLHPIPVTIGRAAQ